MESKYISKFSKVVLVLCAIALIVSIFVPIWAIYLSAPQYPEGLSMFLYASKITGDVDIINGLNHYIGMKTIKENDFWEFKFMPYVLVLFVILFISTTIKKKKGWLYFSTILYLLFCIAFMIDFYIWEYDYGHHLDPNAAIIVPGMSYQPPLIGFKQLLNFGAWSLPDIGGYIMIIIAILLVIFSIIELTKKQ